MILFLRILNYLLMKNIKIQGFSFTIKEGAGGTIKMSAVQSESFDFFESNLVTLVRIKNSTIFMAFKQESPSVRYQLKRSQDGLQVEFIIALDFLPPFSESIVLQKVIGQEAKRKLINKQIKTDVLELEALLSKFKICNHRVQQKNQSFTSNSGYFWEVVLEPGSYLVELSGLLTYSYGQDYYQFGNHLNATFPIQVGIEEAGQKRTVDIFNFYSGPEQSYQQPFNFSILLTIKQEGKAYANFSKNEVTTNSVYCSNIISSVCMISL